MEETKEKERKEKEKEKEEQQQQQEQDGRQQLGTGWCTRRYCVKLLRCMRPDSESNECAICCSVLHFVAALQRVAPHCNVL